MRAAAATTKAAARTTRERQRERERERGERVTRMKGKDSTTRQGKARRVEAGRNKAHSPCQRLCSAA